MREQERKDEQAITGEEKRLEGTAERLENASIEAMKSKALLKKTQMPRRAPSEAEEEKERERERKEEQEAWDEQGLLR